MLPLYDQIFEIFKCPKWDLELSIGISLTTKNDTKSAIIELRPGATVHWNDIKITATDIVVPPLPALGQTFISDGLRVAILEPDLEKIVKMVKCGSKLMLLGLTALWTLRPALATRPIIEPRAFATRMEIRAEFLGWTIV